jgi:hypothetical protein
MLSESSLAKIGDGKKLQQQSISAEDKLKGTTAENGSIRISYMLP